MTRSNPFEEIEDWIERMSEQFNPADLETFRGGSLPVDLIDTGDAFEVRVDLPGVDREDITLTLTDASLSIAAEREEEFEEEADGRYLRRERRDLVRRSIRIPEPIDEDGSEAGYENGVLSVTLPKVHGEEGGRQIDIE